MPTTLASVAISLLLLLPGFAYLRRRQRDLPSRDRSTLDEVGAVLLAGILADSAALSLFLVAHETWPTFGPNVDALVIRPGSYIKDNYLSLMAWAGGLLAAATLFAYSAGSHHVRAVLRRFSIKPAVTHQSAWWMLLHEERRDHRKHISCIMDDGALLRGSLYSFSRVSREHADREIVLTQPLEYRPAGESEMASLPGIGGVALSSRHIQMLMVTYLDPPIPGSADSEDAHDNHPVTASMPLASRARSRPAARYPRGRPALLPSRLLRRG